MYNNEKTPRGVTKVLHIFFLIFIIIAFVILGSAVMKHIDGDSMTVTAGSAEDEECGDEQAQKAAKQAGLKVPVKCKKTSK
jgi:hypothetical protein